MKLLFLSLFILSSCNPLKTLSDGETSLDDNFFEGDIVTSLSHDLISFWKFDETGTNETRYDSVGTNHLTYNTGTINYVTGKRGNALDCSTWSGSNFLDDIFTTNMTFGNNGDFTIAFWVKVNATGGNGVLVQMDVGGSRMELQVLNNNEIDIWQDNASGSPYATAAQLTFGTWYHYAFLFDRDLGVSIYKNGTQVDYFSDVTNDQNYVDDNLRVCNFSGFTSIPNAAIDSLGIWNRLLNTEEISALYRGNNNLD